MKHIKSYKVFEEAGLKPTKKFPTEPAISWGYIYDILKKQVLIHMNW
jgi:hypothetical protein